MDEPVTAQPSVLLARPARICAFGETASSFVVQMESREHGPNVIFRLAELIDNFAQRVDIAAEILA
jgi:hypothetical protein